MKQLNNDLFKSSKINTNELISTKAGKRIYIGAETDCDTGKTQITWDKYGIFGNHKGIHHSKDQVEV